MKLGIVGKKSLTLEINNVLSNDYKCRSAVCKLSVLYH